LSEAQRLHIREVSMIGEDIRILATVLRAPPAS
jgi:hypothetical protein